MNKESFISSIALPNEEWRDVIGFEGKYVVSSLGRVAALSFPIEAGTLRYSRKPHMLTITKGKLGYSYVGLSCGKNRIKTIKVHRLVAAAFLPNPHNYPIINHIDENKTNNRADNLEWCTQKYNINYGTGKRRSAETRIKRLYGCKPVAKLDEYGNILCIYPGLSYAAKDICRDYSAITFSIKHNSRCAGHKWKFV